MIGETNAILSIEYVGKSPREFMRAYRCACVWHLFKRKKRKESCRKKGEKTETKRGQVVFFGRV